MQNKENDLILNMIGNPTMTVTDLQSVGLNVDNTSLASKDVYKNNEKVKKFFTNESGKFNEREFNTFYDNAVKAYNFMAQTKNMDTWSSQIPSSKYDIFAKPETKNMKMGMDIVKIENPMLQKIGTSQIGRWSDPTKTIDEIAQGQGIFDYAKGIFTNDTPEGNFFKYMNTPLVLAQYENNEDDEGNIYDNPNDPKVTHRKGEYKLNNEGTYYYETLGGRDIYGKKVLNKFDVITKEDSSLNQYDFFDSDDIQKSVKGSVMKQVAMVGSMLIPYVGGLVVGMSVLQQAMGLLGTFGKVFTFSSNNSTLSYLEGLSESWSRDSKSQYAQQNAFALENWISLIGDVVGQQKEQRFLFETLPGIFKGSKFLKLKDGTFDYEKYKEALTLSEKAVQEAKFANMSKNVLNTAKIDAVVNSNVERALAQHVKDYNKIGETISKAYMTGITTADSYREAKANGASDVEASLLAIGMTYGEWKILNSDIGEHILPELKATRKNNEALAKALVKVKNLEEGTTREARNSWAAKVIDIGRKSLFDSDSLIAGGTTQMLAHGYAEAVEEVSEEAWSDLAKGIFNTVNWLRGDSTRVGDYDINNMAIRYFMSFMGGAIGGGIIGGVTDFKNLRPKNYTFDQASQELLYMVRNNQHKEFLENVQKMPLGSKHLSSVFTHTDSDGNIVASPYDSTNSADKDQDTAAKEALATQIQLIEDILQAQGARVSDDNILDALTLKDLRFGALANTTTATRYLQEFNSISGEIVELSNELRDLKNPPNKTDSEKRKEEKENSGNPTEEEIIRQDKIKQAEEKLNKVLERKKALLDGTRSADFIQDALFEASPLLSSHFMSTTFIQFAEQQTGKKAYELSDKELKPLVQKYRDFKNLNKAEQVHIASDVYAEMARRSSEVLNNYKQAYNDDGKHKFSEQLHELADIDAIAKASISNPDNIGNDPSEYLEALQKLANGQTPMFTREILSDINEADRIFKEVSVDPSDSQINKRKEGIKHIENAFNILQSAIDDSPYLSSDQIDVLNRIKTTLLGMTSNLTTDPYSGEEFDDLIDDYDVISNAHLKYNQSLDSKEDPLFKAIKDFTVAIKGDVNTIEKLKDLLSSTWASTSQNIKQFLINADQVESIREALKILNLFEATISGAQVDNADLGNTYGYNKVLNELHGARNNAKWTPLAEIDSKIANVMLQDVIALREKLDFYAGVDMINQGQKLTKQDRSYTNNVIIHYNRLKTWIVNVPDDEDKNKLNDVLDSLSILHTLDNGVDRNLQLTDKEYIALQKDQIAMDTAIYNYFQSKIQQGFNIGEIINPETLPGIVKDNSSVIVNEITEAIDDHSFMSYLLTRGTLNYAEFLREYSQVDLDNVVPIPSQEVAVFGQMAIISRKHQLQTLVSQIYKESKKWYIGLDDTKKEEFLKNTIGNDTLVQKAMASSTKGLQIFLASGYIPKFSNIFLVEGAPGVGKSTGVTLMTLEILKKFHPEILEEVLVSHGVSEDSTNKFKESLKLNDKAKALSRENLMKLVSPNLDLNPDEQAKHLIVKNDIIQPHNIDIADVQNPPSLIIIDEISKFTELELMLINKFAKKYDIPVLVMGDFQQNGIEASSIITLDGADLPRNFTLNAGDFLHSPKLGTSLRFDNSQQEYNISYMQRAMQKKKNREFVFQYYEDSNRILGVKNYKIDYTSKDKKYSYKQDQLNSILSDVDIMIKGLAKDEKIGFIYQHNDSQLYHELYNKYADKIMFFKPGEAQGLEANYFIIESSYTHVPMPAGQDKLLLDTQDLYTAISRAKKGVISISPGSDFFIDSAKTERTIEGRLSPTEIKQYKTRRMKIINNAVPAGNNITMETRHVLATTPPASSTSVSPIVSATTTPPVPAGPAPTTVQAPPIIPTTPPNPTTPQASPPSPQPTATSPTTPSTTPPTTSTTPAPPVPPTAPGTKIKVEIPDPKTKLYGSASDYIGVPLIGGKYVDMVRVLLECATTEAKPYLRVNIGGNTYTLNQQILTDDSTGALYTDSYFVDDFGIRDNNLRLENLFNSTIIEILPEFKDKLVFSTILPQIATSSATNLKVEDYFNQQLNDEKIGILEEFVTANSDIEYKPVFDIEWNNQKSIIFSKLILHTDGSHETIYQLESGSRVWSDINLQRFLEYASIIAVYPPFTSIFENLTTPESGTPTDPVNTIEEAKNLITAEAERQNKTTYVFEETDDVQNLPFRAYSFNTLNTGGVTFKDGKAQLNDVIAKNAFIENYAGLVKNFPVEQQVDDEEKYYTDLIIQLRSAALHPTHGSDIGKLTDKVNEILNKKGLTIQFALKQRSIKQSKDKPISSKFYGQGGAFLNSGLDETKWSSNVSGNTHVPRRVFTMVIQAGNTNVLEIPLLNLASPETFLNTVINLKGNPSKEDIMSQIRTAWQEAIEESITTEQSKSQIFITNVQKLLETKTKSPREFKVISAYLKYFKQYNQYDHGIYYYSSDKTLFDILDYVGPYYTGTKGSSVNKYTNSKEFDLTKTTTTLKEIINNPAIRTSGIISLPQNTLTLANGHILKAKHNFVLLTYDKSPKNIVSTFIEEQANLKEGNTKYQTIFLAYLVPKAATVQDFVNYFSKNNQGTENKALKVGNDSTIGHFMQALLDLYKSNQTEFNEKISDNNLKPFITSLFGDSNTEVNLSKRLDYENAKEYNKYLEWLNSVIQVKDLVTNMKVIDFLRQVIKIKAVKDYLQEKVNDRTIPPLYFDPKLKDQSQNKDIFATVGDIKDYEDFTINGKIDSPAFDMKISEPLVDIPKFNGNGNNAEGPFNWEKYLQEKEQVEGEQINQALRTLISKENIDDILTDYKKNQSYYSKAPEFKSIMAQLIKKAANSQKRMYLHLNVNDVLSDATDSVLQNQTTLPKDAKFDQVRIIDNDIILTTEDGQYEVIIRDEDDTSVRKITALSTIEYFSKFESFKLSSLSAISFPTLLNNIKNNTETDKVKINIKYALQKVLSLNKQTFEDFLIKKKWKSEKVKSILGEAFKYTSIDSTGANLEINVTNLGIAFAGNADLFINFLKNNLNQIFGNTQLSIFDLKFNESNVNENNRSINVLDFIRNLCELYQQINQNNPCN